MLQPASLLPALFPDPIGLRLDLARFVISPGIAPWFGCTFEPVASIAAFKVVAIGYSRKGYPVLRLRTADKPAGIARPSVRSVKLQAAFRRTTAGDAPSPLTPIGLRFPTPRLISFQGGQAYVRWRDRNASCCMYSGVASSVSATSASSPPAAAVDCLAGRFRTIEGVPSRQVRHAACRPGARNGHLRGSAQGGRSQASQEISRTLAAGNCRYCGRSRRGSVRTPVSGGRAHTEILIGVSPGRGSAS